MIISASRRTDIPAFFAGWFMERVREGRCSYPNPFRPAQRVSVSLRPEDVDAVVFWSKDPRNLLPFLPELSARGYRYYFQFTVNGYPAFLEPGVPPLEQVLDTFARLADLIAPAPVVWRYDPIVLTDATGPDYHRRRFEYLARRLAPHTRRVVISLFDDYRRAGARLRRAASEAGVRVHPAVPGTPEVDGLLGDLAAAARARGLEAFSCAEEADLTPLGLPPGRCIDDRLLRDTLGVTVRAGKDPGQRPACRCVESRDIGTYGTCGHGCVYCYARPRPAGGGGGFGGPPAERES